MSDDWWDGFDPWSWRQPLAEPPSDWTNFPLSDVLWCPECNGWGFVKLSWYRGFDESREWLPCGRCEGKRALRVKREDLREFADYVPSWRRSEIPDWLPGYTLPVPTTDAESPGDLDGPLPLHKTHAHDRQLEEMWKRLIDGETLCFAPNVDDPNVLGAYAAKRGRVLIVENGENGIRRCYLGADYR